MSASRTTRVKPKQHEVSDKARQKLNLVTIRGRPVHGLRYCGHGGYTISKKRGNQTCQLLLKHSKNEINLLFKSNVLWKWVVQWIVLKLLDQAKFDKIFFSQPDQSNLDKILQETFKGGKFLQLGNFCSGQKK